MNITGLVSQFGGPEDKDMWLDSGLALYEPKEADCRSDLFLPEDPDWVETFSRWSYDWQRRWGRDKRQPTWSRLKTDVHYIAFRYDRPFSRSDLQTTLYNIVNEVKGLSVYAYLVDWGPAIATGKDIDCSPGLLKDLQAKTGDTLTLTLG